MKKTHSKEFVKNKNQSHVILKCLNLAKHCRQEHILHMHILKGNQTFWRHQNPKVEIKEIWVGNNSECTNKGQIKLKETKKKKEEQSHPKIYSYAGQKKGSGCVLKSTKPASAWSKPSLFIIWDRIHSKDKNENSRLWLKRDLTRLKHREASSLHSHTYSKWRVMRKILI